MGNSGSKDVNTKQHQSGFSYRSHDHSSQEIEGFQGSHCHMTGITNSKTYFYGIGNRYPGESKSESNQIGANQIGGNSMVSPGK